MTNEELAIKIKNGERELLTTLWEQNVGIFNLKAFSLYNSHRDRCASSGVELNDVIQICFFALCDAVQAYQPDGEYKFLSYIKFPLLLHFKNLLGIRTSKRNPLNHAGSLNESIGNDESNSTRLDMLVDTESEEPFEAVNDDIYTAELHDALEKSISKLSDNRAAIIQGRYFEGKMQGEIAVEMGVTPQCIHNLERDALRKLRREQSLQSFHDEILSDMAYRHTGLRAFEETWGSSVERAVIRAEELTDRRRGAKMR